MNPFDHMSRQFIEDNIEALEGALFDQVVNPPDSLGDNVYAGLHALGNGLAWFGFWIAVGLVGFGAVK